MQAQSEDNGPVTFGISFPAFTPIANEDATGNIGGERTGVTSSMPEVAPAPSEPALKHFRFLAGSVASLVDQGSSHSSASGGTGPAI